MFTLPDLDYDYSALEPHIDSRTMEIHHTKHHQGYVNNLNAALEKYPDLQTKSLEDLLGHLNEVPEDIRFAVQNNGGGHYNHSLFWKVMSPDGGGKPEGELLAAIEANFGGYDQFLEKFTKTAMERFGSGWVWLCFKAGKMDVCSTKNQNNPLMHEHVPLLGLDVWEHAYYLNYQNRRADYVQAWWQVVNWKAVSENYQKVSLRA